MNAAGIRPVGGQVLILPDQIAQATESGIQIMTDKEMDRAELGQTEGLVVSIGEKKEEGVLEFSSGDRVVFAKFSGLLMDGRDGQRYRLIDQKDVKGVFENE
jgi:chaperonin GroES